MFRNKIIKYLSIIIFMILTMGTIAPSYVNAQSVGFKSFNNAPRKNITAASDKYSDVKITIKDNNQISSVELYSVNAKGDKKKINFSSANTKNSQEHVYTLSHKKMLKGKTKQFFIKITDKTGNVQNSYFRVVAKSKKVNKKTVSYYAIDDGPRVINWTVKSDTTITFDVKDNVGVKTVKLQDGNSNNDEIYTFKNLGAGSTTNSIKINKFKAVNNIYKIRIVTVDSGTAAQQSIRTVYFTLPENNKPANENNNSSSKPTQENNNSSSKPTQENNNSSSKSTKDSKNVTNFIAALDSISQELQKDIKAGNKWTYSNSNVASTFKSAINNNKRRVNCADYVMWALTKSDILKSNQKFYFNSTTKKIVYKNDTKTNVKKTLEKYATIINAGNKLPSKLIEKNKIKKGDILLYDKGGHMNVYAGNKKFYDGGRREGKNGSYVNGSYVFKTFGPIKVNINSGYKVLSIIRLKDQS